MQAKKTDLLTLLPRPAPAANVDFPRAPAGAEKLVRPRVSGWDPYEVWRTRVKAAQELAPTDAGRA